MQKSNLTSIKALLRGISVLFIMALPFSLVAQTEVEGEVSGVWDMEGNPYLIVGETFLPAGDTLLINPGVEIRYRTVESFWINGSLIALGEENDSITFIQDEYGWRGFSSQEDMGEEITLRFVRTFEFRSIIRGEFDKITITNSRCNHIRLFDVNEFIVTNNEFSRGGIVIASNNSPDIFEFQDNLIINTQIDFRELRDCIIANNRSPRISVSEIRISGAYNIEIHNNTGLDIRLGILNNSNITIHNNQGGRINLTGGHNIEIFSNKIISIVVNISDNISVYNNSISSIMYCFDSENIQIYRNRVSSSMVIHEVIDSDIINNTIMFRLPESQGEVVRIEDDSEINFTNNILFGNGPTCTGLAVSESNVSASYNCFYNNGTSVEGIELGDKDIEADPLFTGGNPYEVQLRWDSPCINTGNPDINNDPDGTWSDIGAIPFDNRVDPSPVITSYWYAQASRDWDFNYEAIAVDNGDRVDISFIGLPDWLEIERRDDAEDRITVSGVVPENEQDFTFIIRATDEDEGEDTLTVSVDIIDETILGGEISGELTRDHSPYIALDNLIVPEGENLTIFPGVEIIFPYAPYDTMNYISDRIRQNMTVYGDIEFRGNEDSQIIFRGDCPQNQFNAWEGIYIHPGDNPVEINAAMIRNAYTGLDITGRSSVSLSNSSIEYCLSKCLDIDSCTTVSVEGCSLGYCTSGIQIIRFCRNVVITNNSIYGCREMGVYIYSDSIIVADNNIYENGLNFPIPDYCCGLQLNIIRYGLIHHNIITHNRSGMVLNLISNYQVYNNVISYNVLYGISLSPRNDIRTGSIRNNIITNNTVWGVDGSSGNLYEIRNNLISSNGAGDFNLRRFPEGIGELDSLNANEDSCDIYGNVYLPPEFIGFGQNRYGIRSSSPAIDAGMPDDERDPDGSVADIGAYPFDHENHRPMIHILSNGVHNITLEVGLYRNFDAFVSDQDDELLYYHWSWLEEDRVEIYDNALHDSILYWVPGYDTVLYEVTDGNDVVFSQYNIRIVTNNSDKIEDIIIPDEFIVDFPYPNPFNTSVTIRYAVPTSGPVQITVYDLSGRRVSSLVDKHHHPGWYTLTWRPLCLSNGFYMIKFSDSGNSVNKRLIYLK
ncbi:MAG: right-handed parallel beta-helix repeat-containing protein [Candidatus Hatepunaea meridiana]|nr:right-handed parallel beta-helix repeat-containing protein [Candidatus Hatepunaea meridiana]